MDDRSSNDTGAGIGRRGALVGSVASAIALSSAGAAARLTGSRPNRSADTLGRHAEQRGLEFGCMLSVGKVSAGGAYLDAAVAQSSIIVPGNELKWTATERVQGLPDYRSADTVLGFARSRHLRVRGHTGFWFRGVPSWAVPIMQSPQGPKVALTRISDAIARYRGQIVEWDVVNEIIEPRDGQPFGLRLAPFSTCPGIGFVADCFRAAHAADPGAKLFYNEYGIEYDGPAEDARRQAVLGLLTALVTHGIPIHGLGIQSHLNTQGRFSPPKFRAFTSAVAALGLQIRLTEFDVNDSGFAGDVPSRDQRSADAALQYLDTAFDERAVLGLLTWGLADGDSWLLKNPQGQRADGMPVRTLPLDDSLQPKPLWYAIARALDGAPVRHRPTPAGRASTG